MWRDLLVNSIDDADTLIFGVPFDNNCSVKRGAGAAPSVMRALSEYLPPYTAEGERIHAKVYDAGDVDGYAVECVVDKVRLGKDKKLTLMLGGDHSVSILSQKAMRQIYAGKLGIVHIDAHADICDEYMGSKNSHACVNRRAIENGFDPSDIALVGIRSFEEQEQEYLAGSSVTIYTARSVMRDGAITVAKELIEKFKNHDAIYLSFDIDAVDPAFAPGTGTPEAFGLHSRDVLILLTELIKALKVAIVDFVEISPVLDVNDITSWLALKYILEILAII